MIESLEAIQDTGYADLVEETYLKVFQVFWFLSYITIVTDVIDFRSANPALKNMAKW